MAARFPDDTSQSESAGKIDQKAQIEERKSKSGFSGELLLYLCVEIITDSYLSLVYSELKWNLLT